MSEFIMTGPCTDRAAERALASHYGTFSIERSIVDGQKGYTVIHPNGCRCFHFRLGTAFREILRGIGHQDDREIMVIGEPETGNAWRVER